jgi:hypothetical protein
MEQPILPGKEAAPETVRGGFRQEWHTDQLLSYQLNGVEYPFLAKDEVEKSLPLLKKHYLMYTEYAGVPMKDVFYGWIDTIKPLIAERLGSVVCYGDGKGNFKMADLPPALQMAPIFVFRKIGAGAAGNEWLAGGNFFDVLPYEGRYDAMPLQLFSTNTSSVVTIIPQENLLSVKGQVRDLQWINAGHQKLLLVARNNERLMAFKKVR